MLVVMSHILADTFQEEASEPNQSLESRMAVEDIQVLLRMALASVKVRTTPSSLFNKPSTIMLGRHGRRFEKPAGPGVKR